MKGKRKKKGCKVPRASPLRLISAMTTGKVFGAGDLQDHLGRVGLFGSFETPPLSIVGVMFVVEIVQLIKSFDDGTWRLEANAGNSSNRPLSRSPSCV